jgi:hypothetical protein
VAEGAAAAQVLREALAAAEEGKTLRAAAAAQVLREAQEGGAAAARETQRVSDPPTQ